MQSPKWTCSGSLQHDIFSNSYNGSCVQFQVMTLGCRLGLQGTDKYVPDLELHVLEDCSHWVQQDKPELVEKLIRGFLERTAKGLKLPIAAAQAA